MTTPRRTAAVLALLSLASTLTTDARAHSGPPFPLVSDQIAGAYEVSIWVDPDATDDGSAGGQFWVVVRLADRNPLPPDTRATVTIRPLNRPGPERTAPADPVNGDVSRQFVALLMDHEGRFAVEAAISGPRGPATVPAEVDATYDLRPPPALLALYAVPFVLVGFLWLKLIVRRRRARLAAPQA